MILSVVASSVFAVGSLVWGLLAGSQMIVFDGLYSFVSVALSLLAVWALRAARSGPDERYPWGREIFEPLTIAVKAVALAGLCLYAMVGGVGDLLGGGREIDAGWAVVYGIVATAVGVGVAEELVGRGVLADPSVPVVCLATAHPAKFPDAVEAAVGIRPELPPRLADLFERPEDVEHCDADLAAVQALVRSELSRG